MKKNLYRIIIAVMASAFLIVGALVTTSIVNSKTAAVKRAEKSLSYMSETYAGKFNIMFSESELTVKNLAAVIQEEYVVDDCTNNRNIFEHMKASTREMMREIVRNMNYPAGLYITFAPEMSKGQDEIWYVKDEYGNIKYLDSTEMSDSWLDVRDSTTEYYYLAIEKGSLWFDAEYDPGMKGETVTYASVLRDKNGELIGVIGIDILVDDIFSTLEDISNEIEGYSSFVDKKGVVAGVDTSKYKTRADWLYTEADIGQRWKITLAQPVDVAAESIIKTEAAVILLGFLIIVAVVIVIFYFSRKRVEPMIHEFEVKEAVLINQARQAKMGEMVGNIAHQWKQPLNNMKMSLSNMQDDYEHEMLDKEDFENYVYRMKMMVDNLAETADDFITFLKPGKKKEIFSVNREMVRISNLMIDRIRRNGAALTIEGPEVFIKGYRNELGQCLFNIFDNAIDAMAEAKLTAGLIQVTTSLEVSETGKKNSVISVFNNGEHIDEKNRDRLFDIYFTTKEEAEGTGIGLYLTREIIRNHFNGDVYFENVQDGVVFKISVPAAETAE